ncbi:hypothetical protein EDC01DRAFT_270291 [Geopyxis carbonaria]|nr:hypothetical protein EDC01DRAFT_270291 [Geopyxis carbonaria]
MSVPTSYPVPPDVFRTALTSLPLPQLYAEIARLQNSIAHLQRSNIDLQAEAAAGDIDCKEALEENGVVIQRQEERIGMVKGEIEERVGKHAAGLDGVSDVERERGGGGEEGCRGEGGRGGEEGWDGGGGCCA